MRDEILKVIQLGTVQPICACSALHRKALRAQAMRHHALMQPVSDNSSKAICMQH